VYYNYYAVLLICGQVNYFHFSKIQVESGLNLEKKIMKTFLPATTSHWKIHGDAHCWIAVPDTVGGWYYRPISSLKLMTEWLRIKSLSLSHTLKQNNFHYGKCLLVFQKHHYLSGQRKRKSKFLISELWRCLKKCPFHRQHSKVRCWTELWCHLRCTADLFERRSKLAMIWHRPHQLQFRNERWITWRHHHLCFIWISFEVFTKLFILIHLCQKTLFNFSVFVLVYSNNT